MSLLQTWKDRLIDVSARNPLMNFRFVTAEGKPRTHFVELLDFTEADMHKLKDAGYNEKFYSLEEGVDDYVRNYLRSSANY